MTDGQPSAKAQERKVCQDQPIAANASLYGGAKHTEKKQPRIEDGAYSERLILCTDGGG